MATNGMMSMASCSTLNEYASPGRSSPVGGAGNGTGIGGSPSGLVLGSPSLAHVESGAKILKFYENVTEPPHTGENMRWKCRLCDSRIKSSRRATSNLITHVQRKHPCEFATYQKERESTRLMSGSGSGGCPGASSGTGYSGGGGRLSISAITKYLSTLKYADNDFQQVRLNDALIYMMADNLLPFSFVDSGGFHQLMSVADAKYVPPSAKHLSTTVFPTKRRQLEEALRDQLRAPNQVCVTLDAWVSCSAQCSYLVMAAHFVKQDWTCKSVLLACHVYDGQQTCTSENVLRQYEEVAEMFQIRSKVRHVVTDSALYETRVSNVLPMNGGGHNHHDGNGGGHSHDSIVKRELLNDDHHDHHQQLSSGSVNLNRSGLSTWPVEIQETELLKQLPERMNCFACSLQSVVKYGFQVCQPIVGILSKVCAIYAHLRSSSVTPDLIQNGFLPSTSTSSSSSSGGGGNGNGNNNSTNSRNNNNWHSKLKVARTFLRIPESVLMAAASCGSACAALSSEEQSLLSEFLEIMEPFEEAVDQIQSEQTVSVSNVIPCIRGLRLSLKSMRLNYCCELAERLSECIEAELSGYETCDTFVLATVVDPRFKMDWCSPDEIVNLQAMLFEEMRNAVNTDSFLLDQSGSGGSGGIGSDGTSTAVQPPEDLSNAAAPPPPPPPPINKRPKLFCYMSGSFTTSFRDTEERIAQEITHYLASKCVPHSFDPLGWWKCHVFEFPILSSMARNLLAVCASATSAELILDRRLLESQRHHEITNEQFESMVFLKSNAFA